jgi:hypothetical protein
MESGGILQECLQLATIATRSLHASYKGLQFHLSYKLIRSVADFHTSMLTPSFKAAQTYPPQTSEIQRTITTKETPERHSAAVVK